MRILFLSTALAAMLVLFSHTDASAQPRPKSFGFGLILGDPTGLSLKGDLGGNNSWDGAIGSSWFGSLQIHADYLWDVDAFSSRKVGLYFGLGPVIGFGRGKGILVRGEKGNWYYYDDERATAIGVRVVGGLNAMPFTAPVEFFLELAPLIGLTPATGVGLQIAAGIRYYP